MGLFDKLFGSSEKSVKPKKKELLPLPQRPQTQNIVTKTNQSYSVIRNEDCDGTRIDHYVFRNQKGTRIEDFEQMIWLFGLMEKGVLENAPDFKANAAK